MSTFKKYIILWVAVLGFTLTNAQIKIGDPLPNLSLQNHKNLQTNINAFKGNVVLVDFWASWCAVCRAANKNLVKLHETYKNKGLTVVSISVDSDLIKWKKAITKDKMTHTQLIDPKRFKAPTAVKFGVEALPAVYLFDKNGRLVAINPTEKQIIDQLKK